jgi:hypothetical protein
MFFAMMILMFGFARLMHKRRRRYAHAFFIHRHHHYGHWQPRMAMSELPVPPAPQRRSAFELLRERYVNDDISVEQFEAELDVLMQTPEGRKQV